MDRTTVSLVLKRIFAVWKQSSLQETAPVAGGGCVVPQNAGTKESSREHPLGAQRHLGWTQLYLPRWGKGGQEVIPFPLTGSKSAPFLPVIV